MKFRLVSWLFQMFRTQLRIFCGLLIVFCAAQTHTAYAANKSTQSELVSKYWSAMNRRDLRSAVEIASEGIRNNFDKATFLEFRAAALMGLRKREQAIKDLNDALSLKKTPNSFYLRAKEFWELEELRKARSDIEKAFELDRRSLYKLTEAQILLDLNEPDSAIGCVKVALKLLEKEPKERRNTLASDCYFVLGKACHYKKDSRGALDAMHKCLALTPGWQKASSANDQAMLLKLAKSNGDRLLLKAEAFERLGKLDDAANDYKLLVKAHPLSFEYHRCLLRTYKSLKHYDEALKLLNYMLSIDDQPDLYFKRAEIYRLMGKADLAKIDFERASKSERALMGEPLK